MFQLVIYHTIAAAAADTVVTYCTAAIYDHFLSVGIAKVIVDCFGIGQRMDYLKVHLITSFVEVYQILYFLVL